jgi:hypothetical protein
MRFTGHRLALLFLLSSLTISSCTCESEAPPPPPIPPTRAPGFQTTHVPTAMPTATAAPATPTAPAAAEAVPTGPALPSDFPKDVPILDGATVAAVQQLGGGAHNVLFSTTEDMGKAYEFYKKELGDKGHEVTQQYQAREQSFLSFRKGDMITNVIVAPDPKDRSKRIVAVMYYQEQPAEDF